MMKSWKRMTALLICLLMCISGPAYAEKKQAAEGKQGEATETAQTVGTEAEASAPDGLNRTGTEPKDPGMVLKEETPRVWETPWNHLLKGSETGSGSDPAMASAARMTVLQLREKFPAGKYWNHANNPGTQEERNNMDGWTETPCSAHGLEKYKESGVYTCNDCDWGYQCHGYAMKLGLDATGQMPSTWKKIESAGTAMSVVKPGDIFRLSNADGSLHTIYVIAVRNQEVMYTDCNYGETCSIHWNNIMTKQEIRNRFVYMLQSPVAIPWGGDGACWCNAELAGQYVTACETVMRSGHGTEYAAVVTIPAGIAVQVTRGSEDWMHAECQGYRGYIPAWALRRGEAAKPTIECSWTWLQLEIPDTSSMDFTMYCSGNLPETYAINWEIAEGNSDFFRIDFEKWDGAHGKFKVTALAPGEAVMSFRLVDYNTQLVTAACDVRVCVGVERTTLTSTVSRVTLRPNESKTFTLEAGGYLPDLITFDIRDPSGDCFRVDWPGDWDGLAHKARITGVRSGSGKVVFALYCGKTLMACTEVTINVTGTPVATEKPTSTEIVDESKYDYYAVYTAKKVAYFKAPANQNLTSLTIADTVLSDGVRYPVVGILDNACQGMKKLKEVTIGKNVKTIGKNAFDGCKALKKITFKTSVLQKNGVGKNAFRGIASKPTVKCPKSVRKTYQSILKNAGMPKKAKYK